MKRVMFASLFFLVLFSACSEEEKKLELFSPDAFAFQLENGWELNASVRVKGFTLQEEDDKYEARLSYYVNLVLPSGETLEEITSDIVTQESDEEIKELGIDIQVELDSSYKLGEYNLIFYMADDYTGKETSIDKKFELSE